MSEAIPQASGFAFWRAQVDRLGDREPLEVLGETGQVLERIVGEHPAEAFAARPFDGKWTPDEILGHLIDAEWIFGYRIRTTLADASPSFGGLDQDRWVSAQRWKDADPNTLVETFQALREVNLGFWRNVPPAEMDRAGHHTEACVDLSLEHMQRILAGHDLWHTDQLSRYLEAVGAGS